MNEPDYHTQAQQLYIQSGRICNELQHLLHKHDVFRALDTDPLKKLPEDLQAEALAKWEEAKRLREEAERFMSL